MQFLMLIKPHFHSPPIIRAGPLRSAEILDILAHESETCSGTLPIATLSNLNIFYLVLAQLGSTSVPKGSVTSSLQDLV